MHEHFSVGALAVITLVCDSVQNLCPDDNELRRCTCISTGSVLRWRSSDDQFFQDGIAFDTSLAVGTNGTRNGFTAILTNNTAGHLTSTIVFTPSAVGSTGVVLTCEESGGLSAMTANLNVSNAGWILAIEANFHALNFSTRSSRSTSFHNSCCRDMQLN